MHTLGSETVIDGAVLTDANISGADFRGLDMRLVKGLTGRQLGKALTDRRTRLPEGVRVLTRNEREGFPRN